MYKKYKKPNNNKIKTEKRNENKNYGNNMKHKKLYGKALT